MNSNLNITSRGNLSGLATEDYVDDQISNIDLSGYALKTEVVDTSSTQFLIGGNKDFNGRIQVGAGRTNGQDMLGLGSNNHILFITTNQSVGNGRQVSIPEINSNGTQFVMTSENQTIGGLKTFSQSPIINIANVKRMEVTHETAGGDATTMLNLYGDNNNFPHRIRLWRSAFNSYTDLCVRVGSGNRLITFPDRSTF